MVLLLMDLMNCYLDLIQMISSFRLLLIFPQLGLEILLLFLSPQGPSLFGGVWMPPWVLGKGQWYPCSQPALLKISR